MNSDNKRADELLDYYAAQHAAEVKNDQNLLDIDVPDLLSVLATRVTTPSAMFATPGDRYGTTTAAGQGTRSGPMVEVGKKVALRCARDSTTSSATRTTPSNSGINSLTRSSAKM